KSALYSMAITYTKMTSYFSASIFMKAIPYKTECCLNEVSSILFRNRRIKIVETYSVLTFLFLFLLRKKEKRIPLFFVSLYNTINLYNAKHDDIHQKYGMQPLHLGGSPRGRKTGVTSGSH